MHRLISLAVGLLFGSAAQAAPFIFPASWSARSAAPTNGGILHTSFSGRWATINPFTASSYGSLFTFLGRESLFILDPTTHDYVPYMAESYTVSPDKRSWTLKLRPELRWSDGSAIVAQDFITSYRIHNDPKETSGLADFLTDGKDRIRFSAPDPLTLRVVFPTVRADATEFLTVAPVPSHIFAPPYAKGGWDAIRSMWTLATPPAKIVTSGPFALESYSPERMTLVRNPHFSQWNVAEGGEGLPYLDGRSVTFVASSQAKLTRLLAGEDDFARLNKADDLAAVKRAVDAKKLALTLHSNASALDASYFLTFNSDLPGWRGRLFGQASFRRAMSHLVDRRAMNDFAYSGFGTATYTGVSPAYREWVSNGAPRYDFDPKSATKLLNELGFRASKDGVMRDAAGRALEFDLLVPTPSEFELLAEIFKKSAGAIGVRVRITARDEGSAYDQLYGHKFQAVIYGFGASNTSLPSNDAMACDSDSRYFRAKCAQPWERQVDALYRQARVELDTAKRQALERKRQDLEALYQPFIYLVVPNVHFAWNVRLDGLYPQKFQDSINDAYHPALLSVTKQP